MVGRRDQPRRHPVAHCEPLPSVSSAITTDRPAALRHELAKMSLAA
jgi:hypothetical protein